MSYNIFVMALLSITLSAGIILSISLGSTKLTLTETINALFNESSSNTYQIVNYVRR